MQGLVKQLNDIAKDRTISFGANTYTIAKYKVQGAELIVAMSYMIATQPLQNLPDSIFAPGYVNYSDELGVRVEKSVEQIISEIEVEPVEFDFGNDVAAPANILIAAHNRDAREQYISLQSRKHDQFLAYQANALRERLGREDQRRGASPHESTFGRDIVVPEALDITVYRQIESIERNQAKATADMDAQGINNLFNISKSYAA